ncbi:hypothetical protein [Cupriavidus sp. AU9028]|uniref:hypothetical protein n=1 Tax=Cupriavidus sp. AU9028 TaxID=2871157 RepID=UPI001C95C0CE|nr:hypothetical protein [Cupriavidus sp. AU9028]MBY4896153.1 hypothetical protein [Cupriavidus sp. AU9028]
MSPHLRKTITPQPRTQRGRRAHWSAVLHVAAAKVFTGNDVDLKDELVDDRRAVRRPRWQNADSAPVFRRDFNVFQVEK